MAGVPLGFSASQDTKRELALHHSQAPNGEDCSLVRQMTMLVLSGIAGIPLTPLTGKSLARISYQSGVRNARRLTWPYPVWQ
jgi:hypothetical protein